ncbi:hypothetical protein H4R18_000756 [Coemansia javaensis]|uniref:Uncharacterized protein n=1 Tax=Coemansia javaensis TaxID=2761396 RepID=A0A9W8HMN1_9FUNG|nr:hypothetical protein H4R18_000756 [Coemansia javaensis]
MAQPKRARLGSDCGAAGIRGLRLADERTVGLPPGLGPVSAMTAWVSRAGQGVLVVGTCTGGVALVHGDGAAAVLEGPGGAAIQALLAADPPGADGDGRDEAAAAAAAGAAPDVVAGDAEGHVDVYTLGRRFSRSTLPAAVSALAADTNPRTPSSFLAGDMGGTVAGCHAQAVLWRTQLDIAAGGDQAPDPTVSAVCSVRLPDHRGLLADYTLAASGSSHVQLLSRGVPVRTIPVAAPCTCIAPGMFTRAGRSGPDAEAQAVLGDEAGRLLVLDGFELVPYAQLPHPAARVFALPLEAVAGPGAAGPDVVVCTTLSDTVYVLHGGALVATHALGFWPAAVAVVASFGDAGPAIAAAESADGDGENDGDGDALHIVSLGLAPEDASP